jgi:hypothetical protein
VWQKIHDEWRDVRRIKKLNQELYDLLGGALIYILNYAKKNDILLPNKNRLEETTDRIHTLMIEIDKPVSSDERIQATKNKASDEEEYRAHFSNLYLFPG